MASIETTRGVISYVDHRRASFQGMPLILIHGAGGNHLDWPKEFRKLDGVILPDLPGHGKHKGAGRSSIADYAADIVAFMDALNIEKADIGGMSMGGAISQMITLDYPQRVNRLILMVTGAKLGVNELILNGIRTDTERTARIMSKWLWAKHYDNDAVRELGIQRLLEIGAEVTYNDYIACDNFDVRDRLNEISAPALVIGGTHDKMTPRELAEYLAANISGATLKIIEDAGHMLTVEKSEIVSGVIREWLADQS